MSQRRTTSDDRFQAMIEKAAQQYEHYLDVAGVADVARAVMQCADEPDVLVETSRPLDLAIKTGPANALLESVTAAVPSPTR